MTRTAPSWLISNHSEIWRSLANSVTDNALYLGDVAMSLQSIGNHYRDLGNCQIRAGVLR